MCGNETSETIYIWKVGDVAIAWLSKKTYAKVTVVKDNRGRFHGDKILGVTVQKDASDKVKWKKELCYHVETFCTKQRLWIPWTALRLAERCRPFYGPSRVIKPKGVVTKTSPGAVKKITKVDPLLPFNVKPDHYKTPDFNAKYDHSHQPLKQGKHENSFREFVRRGKEMFFDTYYKVLMKEQTIESRDTLDYLLQVDASTEDKFDLVIKNIMTEREIEDYLHQCWRYNYVHKRLPANAENETGENTPVRKVAPISWCLVCGSNEGKRRECPRCPAAYHVACRKEWLVKIIHRKNPPKKQPQNEALTISKVLSSTRTLTSSTVVPAQLRDELPCPSCMWGPKPGYDDVVWHKLGACAWWPARVLAPGDAPACLLARPHQPSHYPLRYYGTLNHSWARSSQMVLFLPSHASRTGDSILTQAIMDAADDYIAVYLT
ncbi:uncharacterized protein LOC134800749 isoform X2 [Cydia splendana]|uniref:uncharacterized protein LOC134800749 isoform X1 n=1 Tax=Cydia splendana TaxID=1100963 RepID=UPI00300D91AC